ncbi:MAG: Type site-specific deoxyribonuclease [Candidatus Taylorbacteria bacterium]|nr:Type site-specific deoxyribonuclease [Candidatus Taylorbacteria bacterium]
MIKNSIYPYVDDKVFLEEVQRVFNTVGGELNETDKKIHKNVIDPFSAIFDSASQGINYDDWIEQEKHRQIQKTMQNAVGYFHQKIIGAVDGWIDLGPGGGCDVENKKRKIVAEIKNKHNTLNGDGNIAAYDKVDYFLDRNKGYTGYVVKILPSSKKRFNKSFTPSEKKVRRTKKDNLLTVDGATFYEMVTGDKNALRTLFDVLPIAFERLGRINGKASKIEAQKFNELFNRAFGI